MVIFHNLISINDCNGRNAQLDFSNLLFEGFASQECYKLKI